jgi:O-antigen ligase
MLISAALLEPLAAIISETFPAFLFSYLSIGGVPVILFKGDLAFTFMAVSAFLLTFAIGRRHRWWAWAIATLELLFVVGGASRASALGALVALVWLAFSRARRFVLLQVGVMAASLLVLTGLAFLVQNPWAERKFAGVSERVRSLGDFVGSGTYKSAESAMKGDNNRFRAMWWRAVVDETLAESPVFGLGFGHDLARNFLQEYNPEIEDFTARSPHSIVVSAIGRMGLTGLAVFILLCAVLAARTCRVMRSPDTEFAMLGLWAAIWVILISACFGVVLEGPMGAVVFWSLLGLANAQLAATSAMAEVEKTAPPGLKREAPHLRRNPAHDEVAVTS